jgi:hypothetical protein
VALWTSSQHPASTSSIAIIDLRLSSPTRGVEKTDDAVAAKVRRDADRLQVILPPGSEGSYEFELLPYDQLIPVIRGSAQATVDGDRIILNLTVRLGRLAPGGYSLALRREGSEWVHYKLILE